MKTVRLKTLLAFTLIVACLAAPGTAFAAQSAKAAGGKEKLSAEEERAMVARALEELLASMKIEKFSYDPTLPDPFVPFISEKAATVQETPASEEHLTGMRRYEPGQLQLVAIVFSRNRPLAMVQDSSGKGYLIHRGTRIGRSGIVSDIVPNKVVIKQLVYSITGNKKKYKTVEMVIRKEGEK